MRGTDASASQWGAGARRGRSHGEVGPPLVEGLGLGELAEIFDALGRSELAPVFESLNACDAVTIDQASAWLRARRREWLLRWDARQAEVAAAGTTDPFARMLLRREAVAAASEHAEAERALTAVEVRLAEHLGAAHAATLQRALARLQDLAASDPLA